MRQAFCQVLAGTVEFSQKPEVGTPLAPSHFTNEGTEALRDYIVCPFITNSVPSEAGSVTLSNTVKGGLWGGSVQTPVSWCHLTKSL